MPRLNGRITPMEDASAVSRDAGNPPVRFDVAGAGDEVMESPKRARSRKRRTQPRGILHTTAPVPDPTALGERGDLIATLQQSDVFLLPSQTESFGLAALEAMACGVPVVASDVGGVSEVVADGQTGFLAAVGDIAGMARHALRLLTDEDLRRRMARAARHLAQTQFRLAPAVDSYEAVYRRVL